MNRSELLDSYSDFLKDCFRKDWNIDVVSWDRVTMDKYQNPECPNTDEMEYKKCLAGNYLWYLYPHFYKIKKSFQVIHEKLTDGKVYNNLTKPGDKHILDIGAGWLNGLLAYCDFLKEFSSRSYINDNNYNIYVIANEPDSYKTGLLNIYQDKVINLIQEKTGVSINIEYINEPFPNSKDMIMTSLEKKKFFKELIIINACIIKWISSFIPDMYADLSAFSDRTHLINIEPFYSDNKHGIEDKLKELSEFHSNQIDKLHNIPPQPIPYSHPNHPNGPFAHISSHTDSFLMSYYYSTNLQKNFFISERLKEAYYKTRQNIVNSHFHDRIDLIMFDTAINLELERLSVKLAADYKFALTLDYKVHKNRKEDGGYNFRHMSTRKIDNEIVSAAIINPIAETDRYIEDTYGKKCSHGNRLAIQSKTRIYEYFLDNWLEFKRIAIEFAKGKDYSIFQYDIEKYYENIKIASLTENLSAKYMRPKNNHVRKMTESLLTLKCYTTTKKPGCTECSYEDGSHRDCAEINGLPQGPISSGFYANIYLYPLDEGMINMIGYSDDFLYLRYVDDIIIVTSPSKIDEIDAVLKNKGIHLGLRISQEKADKILYTPAEFEQESHSKDVIALCKKASGFLDMCFYVPQGYYDNRENIDFLKKYIECLAEIEINVPDKETVSKRLNLDSKYLQKRDFKEKRFGSENVERIIKLKETYTFPPLSLIESSVEWSKCFITNNSDVVTEFNNIRNELYQEVEKVFNGLKKEESKRAVSELRSLLYRAKYFYDTKYKELAKQVLRDYPYIISYDIALDLISGIQHDSQKYLLDILLQLIKTKESLKDNYLLVARVIRHLSDYYPNEETFAALVDSISSFYEVSDIGTEPKNKIINESSYKITHPSGYLILLLSITDGLLHISDIHWTTEKKSRLFQHLQTLFGGIHIEQIYKNKKDHFIYSFKRSLKINIVTIMAKILNNLDFIDLNLTTTLDGIHEHTRNKLKEYVAGSFSFSDYILSIPESHNPDEYDDEESAVLWY